MWSGRNKTVVGKSTMKANLNKSAAKNVLTYYTLYLYGGDKNSPYPMKGPFVIGEYHKIFSKQEDG